MDDNSSDDEIKDSRISPILGSKKLKLNDGSSQDSLKETASSSKNEKDENVDSGVSADKSESVSSDDRAGGSSQEPTNAFVNAAPSCSNGMTILLNIRPRRERNYRKRKVPGRDSDSNDSSRDSDDLSVPESEPGSHNDNNSNSDNESEVRRILATFSERSSDGAHHSGSESNDTSYSTDDLYHVQSGDTDSDDIESWHRSVLDDNPEENANDEDKNKTPSVLLKQKPKHNYLILREIIHREMGLTFPCGRAVAADVEFEQRFYGSLHAVYRMKRAHSLHKHKGCVNSINFHPEGHLLASGSDDTNVVIWDWARNKPLSLLKTGHKSNVFQSKFLYLNSRSQLNIVTCARDGQVRLLQCPPSGASSEGSSSVVRRKLATHSRAAHKLHVCAAEPHLVVSAGEDGVVMQCDVRAGPGTKLFQVKEHNAAIPLYSVAGHPLDPKEVLVAGRDKFCRVYDRRKSNKPLALYCPSSFEQHVGNSKKKVRLSMMHLTCAVYNHDGTEILGSYNDEDVYLFDVLNDTYDKDNPSEKDGYTHKYNGHRNSVTFKGVSFFGPRSEYIVSGSDCSNIYIWEKKSEAIVQWMKGDDNGVVNCIEPHPRFPVLATSGLDSNVKIWMPTSYRDPDFDGLEKTVRKNLVSQLRSPLFNDFLPQLYSAWRGDSRLNDERHSNIEFDGNVCTTF